jgi:hypothetical protein
MFRALTHLFAAEDGPGDVVVRLRRAAGTGFWASLLDYCYCLSLWIAAPFAWLLEACFGRLESLLNSQRPISLFISGWVFGSLARPVR